MTVVDRLPLHSATVVQIVMEAARRKRLTLYKGIAQSRLEGLANNYSIVTNRAAILSSRQLVFYCQWLESVRETK